MGFAFLNRPRALWRPRLPKTVLRHFGMSAGEIATAARQFR